MTKTSNFSSITAYGGTPHTRIDATLLRRRYAGTLAVEPAQGVAPLLSFPPFLFDPTEERLWKEGKEFRLQRKPMAILRYLSEHPRRLVTHDEIVTAVWGKIALSESVLRTHMHALRRVLGDQVIETVIGRGYRFLLDVQEVDPAKVDAGPQQAAPGAGSMLVGRDEELEVLRTALSASFKGKRQLVFISGDAGVGKTALVDALVAHARSVGARPVRGSCVEQYGSGAAYLPVLDALSQLLRNRAAGPEIETLSRHAPTWLVQMPALIPDGRLGAIQHRAEGATQARMMRELAESLEVLGAARPLVLVLEDLHWSDLSTLELLGMIARRREPARLLIVATSRLAELPKSHALRSMVTELTARREAMHLALDPLSALAVDRYLALRFSEHCFPGSLSAAIHGTTGGHALFVVALVDDLQSQHMVRRLEVGWELAATVEEVAARRPATVMQLIDIKLDRLPTEEQRILEAASVAGASFTPTVVAHTLSVPDDDVEAHCEALARDRRFLRRRGSVHWPDGTVHSEYEFLHALHQHASLARVPSTFARRWHCRIAERLEAGHAGATHAIAAELAGHFRAGGEFVKAIDYHSRAGDEALRRFGSADARGHFEAALKLVAHLPAGRERDATELHVLLKLAPSLFSFGGAVGSPAAVYTRAIELATPLDDRLSLCRAVVGLHDCHLLAGDLRQAGTCAQQLRQIVDDVSDPVYQMRARIWPSIVPLLRGELLEAKRTQDGVRAVLEAPDQREIYAHPYVMMPFYFYRAMLSWLLGFPDDARACAGKAVAYARPPANSPYALAGALVVEGLVHHWRGDARKTLAAAEPALKLGREEAFPLCESRALTLSQWAKSTLDPSCAAALIREHDESQSRFFAVRRMAGRPSLSLPFIEVLLMAGQRDRAARQIAMELDAVEETEERAWEPELHRLRGEVLTSSDRDEAEHCFALAIATAQRQSSRSFELRAAMSLHRLWVKTGKEREAREAVRKVYETFTEGLDTADLLAAKALMEQRPG
jgi:DNA-binding winged helix-turn-helix (wHTH) protein